MAQWIEVAGNRINLDRVERLEPRKKDGGLVVWFSSLEAQKPRPLIVTEPDEVARLLAATEPESRPRARARKAKP